VTLKVLRDCVPPSVPGIMFLSGGQTEDEAFAHLLSVNQLAKETRTPTPWLLSFSYGRAIQDGARKEWLGKLGNTNAARTSFIARAKKLGDASLL
jgi:fructose-bisphosphate aldolase class I